MASTLPLNDLSLSDNEGRTSPKRKRVNPQSMAQAGPKTPTNRTITATPRTNGASEEETARDVALNAELKSLRRINEVVEGVRSSLERSKANMDTVNRTVTNASTLLDTWTRILSQTEHNQRLILNPAWQGATQDLADAEVEAATKRHERERKAAEEAARMEARKADEERRRIEAEIRAAEGVTAGGSLGAGRRGRGVGGGKAGRGGVGRGTSGVGWTNVGRGAARGRPPSSGYGRVTPGVGRGIATRGRGRGIS